MDILTADINPMSAMHNVAVTKVSDNAKSETSNPHRAPVAISQYPLLRTFPILARARDPRIAPPPMPVIKKPKSSGPPCRTSVENAGNKVLMVRPNRNGKIDSSINPPTIGELMTYLRPSAVSTIGLFRSPGTGRPSCFRKR